MTALSTEMQRAAMWIVGRDTGTSSKTIWAVMMGVESNEWPHPPRDVDDFGRCARLLIMIPEWLPRLPEVAAKYPHWIPLVREWSKLEQLYFAWMASRTSATWQAFQDFFDPLDAEGMRLDGWVQDSPSSWHRSKA